MSPNPPRKRPRGTPRKTRCFQKEKPMHPTKTTSGPCSKLLAKTRGASDEKTFWMFKVAKEIKRESLRPHINLQNFRGDPVGVPETNVRPFGEGKEAPPRRGGKRALQWRKHGSMGGKSENEPTPWLKKKKFSKCGGVGKKTPCADAKPTTSFGESLGGKKEKTFFWEKQFPLGKLRVPVLKEKKKKTANPAPSRSKFGWGALIPPTGGKCVGQKKPNNEKVFPRGRRRKQKIRPL